MLSSAHGAHVLKPIKLYMNLTRKLEIENPHFEQKYVFCIDRICIGCQIIEGLRKNDIENDPMHNDLKFGVLNPFNDVPTFLQSTRMQRILKTI